MRAVKYKTYWSYAGKGVPRSAPLIVFLLDIPYFIESIGVLPPLHILNEVLQGGRDTGGMGPGTKWQPFCVSEAEYAELAEAFRTLDIAELRGSGQHPYIGFEHGIIDESLDSATTFRTWLQAAHAKYPSMH